MNIKLCLFSLLFLINFWNKLTAQTIATDRPSALTENATTIYHQGIQIESGMQVNRDSFGNTLSSIPNLLLRYGLTENIEIRIINDLFLSENKQITIGEFQIGSKIQLIKKEKYALAFLPSFQLSKSSMDITNVESLPLSSKFVGSYSFSNSLSAGYTIGYTFNSKTIGYSFLMSQSISEKITAFVEFYGFNDQFNFDTGMAFLIKDNLQLDTYFGTGINNKMYFGSVGISYLFLKQ